MRSKIRASIVLVYALLLAIALVLGACQRAGTGSATISTLEAGPSDKPSRLAPTAVQDPNGDAAMTISGKVVEVSLSARYLRLQYAVDGYDLISLDPNVAIYGIDRHLIELKEIVPGDIVTAWGRTGSPGVLIADKIKIVEASSSRPSPTDRSWVAKSIYHPADTRRFKLTYNQNMWRLIPGAPWGHLEHQQLTGCLLSSSGGYGLGQGWSVEKDQVALGEVDYLRSQVSEAELLRYISFYTEIESYASAFDVHWSKDPQACLTDAEAVLATLEVVSEAEVIEGCRERGGRWERLGILGYGCNLPASDGGKGCVDSSECEGLCLAVASDEQSPAGKCSPWQNDFGCSLIVENSQIKEICVD
jgi:hypothetical protein